MVVFIHFWYFLFFIVTGLDEIMTSVCPSVKAWCYKCSKVPFAQAALQIVKKKKKHASKNIYLSSNYEGKTSEWK